MSDSQSFDKASTDRPLELGDVVFTLRPRARRFVARVDKEGRIAVTVPRGGTRKGALAFANEHRSWLRAEQQRILALRMRPEPGLRVGDEVWWRGARARLELEKDWGRPVLRWARERLYIADEGMNLALPLQRHARELAAREFPERVRELAARVGLKVGRVTIRDQKSRWGSCSSSGNVSLNWRLLLAPAECRDYVIWHELMHLREMNHSAAFWRLVAEVCPNYRESESWLRRHQAEMQW